MSGTCAPRSSVTRSPASWTSSAPRSFGRTTSATGAPSSACSSSTSTNTPNCPGGNRTPTSRRPARYPPSTRSTARPASSSTPTRSSRTGPVPASSRCRPETRPPWRYGAIWSPSPSTPSRPSTTASAYCSPRPTQPGSPPTTRTSPRWSTNWSPPASQSRATARSACSSTTSLALKATRILYVVDARQALHFRMIFATARRAGWLTDGVHAVHVPFGTVLGPDGRPFKTRSGGTVRLSDLLDAAVDRARAVVSEKSHGLDPDQLDHVVQAAGIGAVKYADLSTSRTKDYTFDVDRMVSLNGNTGVYLQYAHARIQSILRKLPNDELDTEVHSSLALQPAERALALSLDECAEVLGDVADALEPHRLCSYLFTLAKTYTSFYETCPVLQAETAALRNNRIALCRLTAYTLTTGLSLLGIEAPERM